MGHTPVMNILVLVGIAFLLAALLGLVGVIATSVLVEVILAVLGLVIIAFATNRLNL